MVTKFGSSQPPFRREDRRFVTGAGRYADDVSVPGQCFAAFVRSVHAHGNIRSISVEDAAAMPGILGVFTGADLRTAQVGFIPYLPIPGFKMGTPAPSPRPGLAFEKVRYVGEPVAIVVAETLEQAISAAEAVVVEIDALPAASDIRAAVAPGAPTIWDGTEGNVALSWDSDDPAQIDAVFASAAHVVRLQLRNNRVVSNPIEPRASLAAFDPIEDCYSLTAASQGVQFFLRVLCEHTFGVPREKMHVRTYDVGGAFGMKEQPYPEDIALLFAARRLGRPVKWSGTRNEHFLSDNHARDAIIDCALALDENLKFLALRADILDSVGAYCSCHAAHISIRNTTNGLPLVYQTPVVHSRVKLVMTNAAPIGPYRGAGREQAAYIVERLVDQAARELGVDPIDLRLRNLIRPEALPYRTPSGRTYDSGEFEVVLKKALDLSDWAGFDERARTSGKRGRIRGRGVSCFLECVGGIPFEGAFLRFTEDNKLSVVLATQSSGQGHETSFAQIAAARLGIPFESVEVSEGDSFDVPRGLASVASRSTIMAGSAIAVGCDLIIEKGRKCAAQLLEASEQDVRFADGTFTVAGTDLKMGLFEIANSLRKGTSTSSGLPDSLDTTGDFEVDDLHFPNGCHICEIEIDPETGLIELDRYCAIDDVGTVINPTIVQGQVHGGIAQGVGQALMEHCRYDDEGQLITATFLDYAMPRAAHLPPFAVDFHPTPSTKNPLGVKGTGEVGVTGALPAVSNAVADALARVGVTQVLDMPFTAEKIWRALR